MSTSQFTWPLGGKPIVLDQLDEELRIACGLALRPGLQLNDVAIRTVALIDDLLRPQADVAFAAHVPDPGFAMVDARLCAAFLKDAGMDAFLALVPGTATAVQRDTAIQRLIASHRALIRIVRGIAT